MKCIYHSNIDLSNRIESIKIWALRTKLLKHAQSSGKFLKAQSKVLQTTLPRSQLKSSKMIGCRKESSRSNTSMKGTRKFVSSGPLLLLFGSLPDWPGRALHLHKKNLLRVNKSLIKVINKKKRKRNIQWQFLPQTKYLWMNKGFNFSQMNHQPTLWEDKSLRKK